MRALFLLLGFVVLSACAATAPLSADAQSPPPDLAACLVNTEVDARSDCIGIVSEPCLEAQGGDTTSGMVQCVTIEREQWQALYSQYVSALRERESETQTLLLDAMRRDHARWTVSRCAYAASYYEGGSLARYLATSCARDTWADITIELYGRLSDEP